MDDLEELLWLWGELPPLLRKYFLIKIYLIKIGLEYSIAW